MVHNPPKVIDLRTSDYGPLIPEGTYEVAFSHHETALMFGKSPKLTLWFRVVTLGPHFETLIPRYYTVKRPQGKVGRNGGFAPTGPTSVLVIEYVHCHERRPNRLDRIPMSAWADGIYRARVRTVTRNSHQKRLPKQIQYSVIDEPIRRAE